MHKHELSLSQRGPRAASRKWGRGSMLQCVCVCDLEGFQERGAQGRAVVFQLAVAVGQHTELREQTQAHCK